MPKLACQWLVGDRPNWNPGCLILKPMFLSAMPPAFHLLEIPQLEWQFVSRPFPFGALKDSPGYYLAAALLARGLSCLTLPTFLVDQYPGVPK